MTKPTEDPIASRRRLIAREAVLLPGDPSLRDVIVALVPKGLDLLEVSVGDLATALRGYHKESRHRGRSAPPAITAGRELRHSPAAGLFDASLASWPRTHERKSEIVPVVRKLAAILAADVVGYGLVMGADEEGTLIGG